MDFGKWGSLIEVFLAKNAQINLSAIRDAEGVYVKHILDSLELLNIFVFEEGQTVCDLGTGWGFPLLPLAIENSDVRFVGMDARKKKLQAIGEMIESLQWSMVNGEWWMVLWNIDLVWSRVEEYKGPKFAVVMARAVAHVEVLIPWMMQIVKKKGTLILYKEYKEEEKMVLEALCRKYKLSIKKEHKYVLEGTTTERVIYILG
jgi:16S rRNA (guanine527-N7)-methyltransferase